MRKQKANSQQAAFWTDVRDTETSDMIDSCHWSGLLSAALDLAIPRCRYFVIYPDWYGVLHDFAIAAGYRDAEKAARLVDSEYIKSVRDVIPQGTLLKGTLQLQPHQLLVTRWGAYDLFTRSESPKAKPIKKRLYELIDEALGIGGRSVMNAAAQQEQRRLGSTAAFAILRSENRSGNREINRSRLNRTKYYNARWEGATGYPSRYWREQVSGAPLDRCSELTLSIQNTAEFTIQGKIRLAQESGVNIDLKTIPDMIKELAQDLRDSCLKAYGAGADFGVTIELRRGKKTPIVDVVRQGLGIDGECQITGEIQPQ